MQFFMVLLKLELQTPKKNIQGYLYYVVKYFDRENKYYQHLKKNNYHRTGRPKLQKG